MRVTVINGSPKGQDSVTLRFVEFLQLSVRGSEFTTFHVGKQIRGFESREEKMAELKASVAEADLVLFATPVYYMTVPSQLMRFVALMMHDDHRQSFAGKRVALLTTSIHFFDHTAFDYMRAVFDKAGMLYTYGFSAHMEDLTKKEGQGKLAMFAKKLAESVQKKQHMPKRFLRHGGEPFRFEPSRGFSLLENKEKRVLILADSERADSNLPAMIERFASNFMNPPKVVWLKDVKMASGCIGCLKCAMDLQCVFTQKDGHRALLDEEVVASDILVMASDITNCYLTSAWQQFFTRLFFNGHVPYFSHKQVGFLFSGPYTNYPYIREIFDGFVGYAKNGIYEYLSDESADQGELEEHLDRMAQVLLADSERAYFPAPKFQAISAQKLFRDEIFDQLRVVFQHDHRYFKKHRMYDFPTKKLGKRLVMTMLSWLLRIPGLRRRFYTKEMIPGMLRPYEKVLRPMRRAQQG